MIDYKSKVINIYLNVAYTYWGISTFFLILDVFTLFTGTFKSFRYLKDEKINLNFNMYLKCVLTGLFTFLFTIPLVAYVFYLIVPYTNMFDNVSLDLYFIIEQLIRFIFCMILEDILFYIVHRSFHKNTYLYNYIHKKHHELIDNCGFGAIYATQLENIIANLLPTFLCPLVCRIQGPFIDVWFVGGVATSVFSHSGYKFPSIFKSLNYNHDLHHKYYVCSFGVMGIMDYLFKTRFEDRF